MLNLICFTCFIYLNFLQIEIYEYIPDRFGIIGNEPFVAVVNPFLAERASHSPGTCSQSRCHMTTSGRSSLASHPDVEVCNA